MGLVPLEELLAERDELVRQVAPLRALHGPGGTWDDMRRMERSRLAPRIRAIAVRDEKKLTEAAIDDAALSDLDYAAFVAAGTREKAAYYELEARIQGIEFTINRGQAIARYLAAEVHLGG